MLIKIKPELSESEVTDPATFKQRRRLIKAAAGSVATGFGISRAPQIAAAEPKIFSGVPKSRLSLGEEPTDYEDVISYNNFYEFGTGKSDPARNSQNFQTRPWTVSVEGEVAKPGIMDMETILKRKTWKNAFTGFAVWKPGLWSSLGWAFRWGN